MSGAAGFALRAALGVARSIIPASTRERVWRAAWNNPAATYALRYPQWRAYTRAWAKLHADDLRRTVPGAVSSSQAPILYAESGSRESGFNDLGSFWWLDPRSPHAYQFTRLDETYPEPYFERAAHPSVERATDLYAWMQAEFTRLTGRPFQSVLEMGSGGGHITQVFQDNGLDYLTVEGTQAGCARLLSLGIPAERITQADIRTWAGVDRRFDLVMCTELVEHIELPFTGNAVMQASRHADHVWFSSPAPPPEDGPRHLQAGGDFEHPSCMPLAMWDNLFAFFGLDHFVSLDPYDCTRRGMRLYYRRSRAR